MQTSALLIQGYNRLFKALGHQKWWPGDTPFEIIVGAILTQNTNWKNVEKAIANLKRNNLLTPKKLKDVHFTTLASLIRPAGYYRVKAKRLRKFLDFLCAEYKCSIGALRVDDLDLLRKKLLSVHGIGPETADSILLYALEKPTFVVDAYTKRILHRHQLIPEEITYEELQAIFMDNLPHSVPMFNEYHALLVKCAKNYCRVREPRCSDCPLNGWNM